MTRRDDDRELQTEQTIVGLLAGAAQVRMPRKIIVWKTQALCVTVAPKQSEVCHEPARCRRQQGCGPTRRYGRLCAAARAHGRTAGADRRAWRSVLYGV